jgi:hypothetical protein
MQLVAGQQLLLMLHVVNPTTEQVTGQNLTQVR